MTREGIRSTIMMCEESIYLAVQEALIIDFGSVCELDCTITSGEKITKLFIDYENCDNGDNVDYVAVVADGQVYSLVDFNLQDMIIIAEQLDQL